MSHHRSGFIVVAVIACLLLGWPPTGSAQVPAAGSGTENIEPVIGRRDFVTFLGQLQMDEDLRVVAELLYSDYAVALEELAVRLDAAAAEAGRERVADALAGRAYVEPAELRRLRVAVLKAYSEGWADADQLVEQLLDDVRSLQPEEQAAGFDHALFGLRRVMYLGPRRAEEQDEEYAGDGADVCRLFEEARLPGGELYSLDERQVAPILSQYASQLDALLSVLAAADREGRFNRTVARIERDSQALNREEQSSLARWQQMYQLNHQTVRQIAGVVGEQVGAVAQQQWLQRFDRACFPWLYKSTTPDRELDWIKRNIRDEQILARAAEIHGAYQRERNECSREATGLILRGRLALQTMLHARLDPSRLRDEEARKLYQDLLKNSGQLSKLDADTAAALESLLTDTQRRQMKSDIAAAAYGRRR